jgi:hypothetical protein
VYVGNGHKYQQNASFYPVEPPVIESDPAEYQDGPEPNPLVAPVEAVPEVEEKEQDEVADPDDDE